MIKHNCTITFCNIPAAPAKLKFPVATVRATFRQAKANWLTFSTRLAESGSSIGIDMMPDITNNSEDSSWILQ